ncbi:UNVERIFIED_ORG: hypothetical protein J2W66_004489 [Agrobacterium larrymoorei]|nr:hypothetical protein [Agrobacterium larrymoorei]
MPSLQLRQEVTADTKDVHELDQMPFRRQSNVPLENRCSSVTVFRPRMIYVRH